jgi:hypothetical protein
VLENLRRGCETLGYGELIQFLQCHFNHTLSRKLLSNLDCIAFSWVSCWQTRTYSMGSV